MHEEMVPTFIDHLAILLQFCSSVLSVIPVFNLRGALYAAGKSLLELLLVKIAQLQQAAASPLL
jgi:hypothetical protein